MSKISCHICMDLIPLVKDDIASEESYNAVMEHISDCESCKTLFYNINEKNKINNENIKMNDKKIISKIKKQLTIIAVMMIVLGSFIGVGISESQWIFYNVVLMPIVGGLGYFVFNGKSYIVPIGIFGLTYIWNFIKNIIDINSSGMSISEMLIASGTWAAIHGSLCALGVVIGFLLYIAFKRENG